MYNEEDRLISEIVEMARPICRALKLDQKPNLYAIAERLNLFNTRGTIKSFGIIDHKSDACEWHAGALFGSGKDYVLFVDENASGGLRHHIFWGAVSILLVEARIDSPFYFDHEGTFTLFTSDIVRVRILQRCLGELANSIIKSSRSTQPYNNREVATINVLNKRN